jgi:hypothetical protein
VFAAALGVLAQALRVRDAHCLLTIDRRILTRAGDRERQLTLV